MAKLNEQTMISMRRLLASLAVMSQKTQTYHWDLTGLTFVSLHEHLGEVYEAISSHTDEVAERIRQLGEPTKMTLSYATTNSVVEDNNPASAEKDIITDMMTAFTNLYALQLEILMASDEQNDPVTVDLMTKLCAWAEKENWFFNSMLSV